MTIQSPVNFNTFTQIFGFDGSPLSLIDIAFDIESNKGFFSGFKTEDVGHPQLQLILWTTEYSSGLYTSIHLEFVVAVFEQAQVCKVCVFITAGPRTGL